MKNTIKTDERIFQVRTFEFLNEYRLVNLNGFKVAESGEIVLSDGTSIKSVKHLWNNRFETISKREVKTMINSNLPA